MSIVYDNRSNGWRAGRNRVPDRKEGGWNRPAGPVPLPRPTSGADMSEPWQAEEPMYCACGCGREVVDDSHARVEDIVHDGIPVLAMYATAKCAAKQEDTTGEEKGR